MRFRDFKVVTVNQGGELEPFCIARFELQSVAMVHTYRDMAPAIIFIADDTIDNIIMQWGPMKVNVKLQLVDIH